MYLAVESEQGKTVVRHEATEFNGEVVVIEMVEMKWKDIYSSPCNGPHSRILSLTTISSIRLYTVCLFPP
jgi:hypothetical protein